MQAKERLTALEQLPDPTISYFLQLIDFALEDLGRSSRRRWLATQLEILKGLPDYKALMWVVGEGQGIELAEDPHRAAHQALEELDSRMTAELPGYPPPTPAALL
jgi:hypothetical protein